MRTQIITLEAHDDLITVRDRMSWAKSPRILLVWPGFARVALRPVDLRILQQHARYLGAELGLVSRRADIRRDAEGFDIPVFRSTVEAQRQAWHRQRPDRSERPHKSPSAHSELRAMQDALRSPRKSWATQALPRIVFFVLGVLAVIVVAALFIPRAEVRLLPKATEQSAVLAVRANTANTAVSITGRIPAYLTSIAVEGTQSAKIASQMQVPQEAAKGTVRFQNLTQAEVVIPAGTVVYSVSPTAARFFTLTESRLEPKLNSTVDAPIQAQVAGQEGNVPANSIVAIEGSLGGAASVTNPDATAGGSDRTAVAPSDGDRARVRGVLLDLLKSQALAEASRTIQPDDLLLPATANLIKVDEEQYEPPAGRPGSLLTVKMRAEFALQFVKAEDLRQLSQAALDATLPAGFRSAATALAFEMGKPPRFGNSGESEFDLNARRTIYAEIDLGQARRSIRGLTPSAASRLLQESLPLSAAPEINVSPPWWPWLPLIPFRIGMSLP